MGQQEQEVDAPFAARLGDGTVRVWALRGAFTWHRTGGVAR